MQYLTIMLAQSAELRLGTQSAVWNGYTDLCVSLGAFGAELYSLRHVFYGLHFANA